MDSDQDAQFEIGPPDKRSNFNKSRKCPSDLDLESDLVPLVRKGKGKSNKITDTFKGVGQRVEVRYNDGVWYKGTLIEFNVKTGNWNAQSIGCQH